MCGMSKSMDIDWIVKGLEKYGKTKTGLAKALGKHPSVVSHILAGNREIKAREIAAIAHYLDVKAPEMSAPPEKHQITTAMIMGDVAAGVWAEPGISFEPIPSTIVVDARWPAKSVYLLRVRGTSINRQAKNGDLVLCLDAFAAPRDFQHGDWVVAERTDAAGRKETTVKRVHGNRYSGFDLRPDSDDPAFQSPIAIGKNDGETVEIKAFVLEFIKPATSF